MRKLMMTLALCGLATPALAHPVQHFTDLGEDYAYTVARDAHGQLAITGTEATTHDDFRLVLVGHTVRGNFGSQYVTFPVSDAQIARLNDEFAATEKSEAIAAN